AEIGAGQVLVGYPGEINPGADSQLVPRDRPGVDFHQSERVVAGVELEFDADESTVVEFPEKTSAQLNHLRGVDGDLEGAISILGRKLAELAFRNPGQLATVLVPQG